MVTRLSHFIQWDLANNVKLVTENAINNENVTCVTLKNVQMVDWHCHLRTFIHFYSFKLSYIFFC